MKKLSQLIKEKLIINKNYTYRPYRSDGEYEMPKGDISKIDNMILNEFAEMGNDKLYHYDTFDDSEFYKLHKTFKNKLAGYDVTHNRIDDMEKLINYIVKDLFNEKYIIHVYTENAISDKIADELGDDNFFELFSPSSRSSFKYYIGEETAYIQYRRGQKPFPSDFDIFIFKF
jgi:hypothetical protein